MSGVNTALPEQLQADLEKLCEEYTRGETPRFVPIYAHEAGAILAIQRNAERLKRSLAEVAVPTEALLADIKMAPHYYAPGVKQHVQDCVTMIRGALGIGLKFEAVRAEAQADLAFWVRMGGDWFLAFEPDDHAEKWTADGWQHVQQVKAAFARLPESLRAELAVEYDKLKG